MKTVRITLLGCLAAVWIVACGQDTAEPPSPDPVDSLDNEEVGEGHLGTVVGPLWKTLGKNPINATKAELATVTHLRVTRGSAYYPVIEQYELELLVACINLVELEIVDTYLTDEQLVALAGLTKLESLKLRGSNITDLSPIAGLTNLRMLDTSDTPIADLSPLAGLVNLQRLYLAINDIADLSPLAGLVNLQYLDLASNDIVDLSPLADLVNLQYLDLSINDIADLSPLVGLVQLRTLNLAINDIADLSPLAGLVNLQYLDLSINDIADLSPLMGLVRLRTLNLRNNKIVDIQSLLDNVGIGAGDKIELQGNNLSDISRNQHIPALEARGVTVIW